MFAAVLAWFSSCLFVADASPGLPVESVTVIVGLLGLAAGANQIMAAISNFRKLRGSDPDSDTRYATKGELAALRDDVLGMQRDFTALSRTINHSFNDLQRSIGRLEGKIDGKNKE